MDGKWGWETGGWTYPMGSKVIPDIMFDWLLIYCHFRTIFRAKQFQGFLSPTAKVYSPVLTERKIYMGSSDEVMFDFVEGKPNSLDEFEIKSL